MNPKLKRVISIAAIALAMIVSATLGLYIGGRQANKVDPAQVAAQQSADRATYKAGFTAGAKALAAQLNFTGEINITCQAARQCQVTAEQ